MAKEKKKVTQKEALTGFLTNMEEDEFTHADEVLTKVVEGKVRYNVNKQKVKLFKPTSK